MIFAGLDLGGYKKKEKTVLCFVKNKKINTFRGLNDKGIIMKISSLKPSVFAIDAPLSFPLKEAYRYSDKKLREFLDKRSLKYLKKFILPPVIPSMKIITQRAIRIKNSLKGIKTIETHPTICIFLILIENKIDAKKFLKYKKDKSVFLSLLRLLKRFLNYELNFDTVDELDSFICAYIAQLFYKDKKIFYLSRGKSPFIIYNL